LVGTNIWVISELSKVIEKLVLNEVYGNGDDLCSILVI
jgi:hypothetical protein